MMGQPLKFIPMPTPFYWDGEHRITFHDDGSQTITIKMKLEGAAVWLPVTSDILKGMVSMMKQTQGDSIPWRDGDTLHVEPRAGGVYATVGDWEALVL